MARVSLAHLWMRVDADRDVANQGCVYASMTANFIPECVCVEWAKHRIVFVGQVWCFWINPCSLAEDHIFPHMEDHSRNLGMRAVGKHDQDERHQM